MGTVIRFPFEKRMASKKPTEPRRHDSASVVILPVVRIERWSAGRQPVPPAAVRRHVDNAFAITKQVDV
jgi:hypothetical protein